MEEKINLLFVIPSLVPGGAERVISFVSKNIDKSKFNTILLVIGFKKDVAYNLDGLDVFFLNKQRVLYAIPKVIRHIFSHKPNIVISSIAHLNIVMGFIAFFFPRIKFIGREATILSYRKPNDKKKWKSFLFNFIYKNLDALICQSKDMKYDMIKNYEFSKKDIYIINNPISSLSRLKVIKSNKKAPKKFITVGRLSEIKGHLRILKILSKLRISYLYTIIGNGELKDLIFEKAKELGISNNINYIPFTRNVNDYLIQNDMFLQGSFVEGFPNASLESCVAGIPVVAFNVPGGTKEIIVNDVNGFLVDTEEEFLKKIQIEKEWVPEKIRESVVKKFNQEKILSEYEDLFIEIMRKNN